MKDRICSALKQNLVPGIVLWVFGLCVVSSYYYLDFTHGWFNEIIGLKQVYGYAYSAASTAIFGGLIPFIFMRLSGRETGGNPWFLGGVFVSYWGLRGWMWMHSIVCRHGFLVQESTGRLSSLRY